MLFCITPFRFWFLLNNELRGIRVYLIDAVIPLHNICDTCTHVRMHAEFLESMMYVYVYVNNPHNAKLLNC